MKAVFLDIDGVLQPFGRQERFEHLKNGDIEKLAAQLNETIKDRGDFDYSKYLEEISMSKYDLGAVYYDWDPASVALLKKLLDRTGAKIVISSDWRDREIEVMSALFAVHDLKKYILGMTWTCGYPMGSDGYDDYHYLGYKLLDNKKIQEGFNKRFPDKDGKPSYVDSRTLEIREYLDRHPEITNFVALDDRDLEHGLEGHFVRTEYKFTQKEFDKALAILDAPDDGPYYWPIDRTELEKWRASLPK